MKEQNSSSDNYDFWIKFICGLVLGAGGGAWLSWGLFESRWAFIGLTAAIALVGAFCCALWGREAWEKIVDFFWWFH